MKVKYDIPLKLAELKIPNKIIEKKSSIKFSGGLLDENIPWRIHTCLIEKKILKNIGLLQRVKQLLRETSL